MPPSSVITEKVPRVDHADLITVRLPFVHAFGTSVNTWLTKEALLLRLESGGLVAWGECVADPDPYYLPETTGTCAHIIREFLWPRVKPAASLEAILESFGHIRGHEMAKATVENALLNLIALRRGVPLHALLGFPARPIMSGISIGLQETLDELLSAVQAAVAKRYHRVKIKIMRGKDVEWVRAVRDCFPVIELMVDANGDYTLADAPRLRQLDVFSLTMIEQPLSYNDIYQHSLLQRQLATPLCLDESLHALDDVVTAIELHACGIINIKQGRMGGLLASACAARYARNHGIGVWSGGMDETGIGRAVNIHLQTADGFTLPGDTSETSNYFTEDIADPPVVLDADGYIAIPPGPGPGITVDPDRLRKYTIHHEPLL